MGREPKEIKNFADDFRAWKKQTNFSGPTATTRFVMFIFFEELNKRRPGEYIMKGGNLLWHYINTPRPTTDLDITTATKTEVADIVEDMKGLSSAYVTFSLTKHEVKVSDRHVGILLKIAYVTDTGQQDAFGIDCVLKTPTAMAEVKFLQMHSKAATMENIIMDKLQACHTFGKDNTRMKDFDDLFRIVTGDLRKIKPEALIALHNARGIALRIDPKLGDSLNPHWKRYLERKGYPGSNVLPGDISQVIEIINETFKKL